MTDSQRTPNVSLYPNVPNYPTESKADYLPAAYRSVDAATRGAFLEEKPHCVFIEVTNHCNLLCETCPRTFVTYEEPKTLSWENFLKIADQFPKMERAVLHGIGEPLINKDLPRMIAHLKARGVYVLFNTNATLLDEEWSRQLIESGLDELRCSIDGADPKTYALIRGAPLLHKIVSNLTEFMQIQQAMGAETPRASIWMTGVKENIEELPGLLRLAAKMGVPEVYLQRLVYYYEAEDAPGMMDSGHGLFDSFDDQVDQLVADGEALARELGIMFKASGATNPRASLGASNERDKQPWKACMRPWTTAYITANGNALPCCISPFATQNYESLKLGNVFEQPFDEIWNDERYQAWRTQLLSDEPHEACAGCGVHWSL
ncbi:MAG: radical SAM protein [Chloroflexi bacterium]|nr:radical SAM protein [Chloroflexota bacterium]